MWKFDILGEFGSVSRNKKILKPGDIIAIKRLGGAYQHFAVYIGNDKVIHYADEKKDGIILGHPTIHEADFKEFLKNDDVFEILEFEKFRSLPKRSIGMRNTISSVVSNPLSTINLADIFKSINYHLYTPEETIERAKSKLGEDEYSLIFNNCEHFAIWCKTGISESRQIETILEMLSKI